MKQSSRKNTKQHKKALTIPNSQARLINTKPHIINTDSTNINHRSHRPGRKTLLKQHKRGLSVNNGKPNPTMMAIPELDLDDFFPKSDSLEDSTSSNANDIPTFNPRTIKTVLPQKHTITLVTKDCCSLCILPFKTIKKAYQQHPDTFNYVEIDINDPENEELRGRYKYHIPVVQVNGWTFSTGKQFDTKVDEFNEKIIELTQIPFDQSLVKSVVNVGTVGSDVKKDL